MPLPINITDLLHGKAVEWERLEFKKGWNPLEVLHTICAFANDFHNLGGGYIVLGVAEKHGQPVLPPEGLSAAKIDGIQKDILRLGNTAIQPNYHPVVVPYEISGRSIIVIWAPGGQTRPYKAKVDLNKGSREYGYYIRKGSTTVRAKGGDETELLSLAATVPFDDRINQQARIEDFSRDLMQAYLEKVGSELAIQAPSLSLLELGRQMGVVGGPAEAPFPLNIGLMMFNPEPHRFFPVMQIDVVWFPKEGPGGDRFSEKVFRGPLPRMTGEALDYIRRNFISETVIKHPDRAEATRVENFPYAAIEEAVVNAVYHRGYDVREPVEVRIKHDELVVLSYPGPDRSVRLEQLRAGRAQPRRYRNRRIGEFLKELEFTEGRATGIPKIMHVMKQNGSPPADFEFDEDYSYFMVRLPVHPDALEVEIPAGKINGVPDGGLRPELRPESRPKSRPKSRPELKPEWDSESIHNRIMQAISLSPLARSEVASILGHKSVSGAVKLAFADLFEAGLIEMTIPDKPNSRLQQYRLTAKGRAWVAAQKKEGRK